MTPNEKKTLIVLRDSFGKLNQERDTWKELYRASQSRVAELEEQQKMDMFCGMPALEASQKIQECWKLESRVAELEAAIKRYQQSLLEPVNCVKASERFMEMIALTASEGVPANDRDN